MVVHGVAEAEGGSNVLRPGLPELEAWAAAHPALLSAGGCLTGPLLAQQPILVAGAAGAGAPAQPAQV